MARGEVGWSRTSGVPMIGSLENLRARKAATTIKTADTTAATTTRLHLA